MRIWMVNHYAVPPTSGGGTRHYHFAHELIRRGHEVVIVAANYSHFSHSYRNTAMESVPFYWVDVPPYKGNTVARLWNMVIFGWRVGRLGSDRLHARPDVIIGSSPHLFSALGAAVLAKRLRVPFVLEVRDIWPESLVDLGRFTHRHPLIRLMKAIERFLYRRATKVISLLPAAAPYFIKHGVKASDITWLPNYADTRRVQPFRQLKPKKDKFTVMYAGAHGLANDLDTVIDAAVLLQKEGWDKQVTICLIGEGPEKMRLQERAAKLNITMIHFMDAVSKEKIYAVMAEASAFLMLLKKSPVFRWGVSPNKLFDYLLMGRPVIFGVETPVNPVKESGAGISFMPGDPVALAHAIVEIIQTPHDERDAMGRCGQQYVEKHHDVVRLTNKLETLLGDVATKA